MPARFCTFRHLIVVAAAVGIAIVRLIPAMGFLLPVGVTVAITATAVGTTAAVTAVGTATTTVGITAAAMAVGTATVAATAVVTSITDTITPAITIARGITATVIPVANNTTAGNGNPNTYFFKPVIKLPP